MNQALKFESKELHLDRFVFALADEHIITAGNDFIVKLGEINEIDKAENVDVRAEIGAISYGCGKIAYGNKCEIQIMDASNLSKDFKFNPDSSTLLTNFNSTVRKIIFNENFNLLVAFSEDDDLQIVNLNTMDVYKYKSNHDGSLKNMQVSPKGEFLVTTGCDGYLSIYDFKSDSTIQMKKKMKIHSQKVTLESPQRLEIDINFSNLCAISGSIFLKTVQLDSASLEMKTESQISHSKGDISMVKWLRDLSNIIITGDLQGVFKIWNYSNSTCLFQVDFNLGQLQTGQMCLVNENSKSKSFSLLLNDINGKIYITEGVSYSSLIQEEKVVKSESGGGLGNNLNNTSAIDEILGEFEKQANYQNNISNNNQKNSQNNSNKTENQQQDLLDLSDLEDENGEIKDKSEIEKAKEEKKLENLNQYKHESIADDIIQCLPQQTFYSSATNTNNLNSSRYLCWNMIGQIISRQETSFKAIDITFSDISNKKKVTYIDTNDLVYGVMNNCGALLANKLDEENEDEYEREDKRDNGVLVFKSIHNNQYSLLKDWVHTLPARENPIALAIGTNFCAVYTSAMYLRTFSLYGNEKMVISIPHVISMAGYENFLALVYHSSAPLFGCQSLRFKILNSDDYFNEIFDGVLPLSPEATLNWFSFSEDGILLTCDSRKVIRGFIHGVCNNWLPLLDLEALYESTPGTNFFLIGMSEEEIYGLELKNYLTEPTLNGKFPVKLHKVKLPFSDEKEENIVKNSIFIKYDTYRLNTYSNLKDLRNVKSPDFYYTDNLKFESDIKKRKVEHDQLSLSLMNDFIVNGNYEKVVSLFESLMLNKSREGAFELCRFHEIADLEILLRDKEKEIQLKEMQKEIKGHSSNRGGYFNYDNENQFDNENGSSPNKKNISISKNSMPIQSKASKNPLSSLAFNLDNLRSMEEEARNELGLEEEGKNDMSNLEAKVSGLGVITNTQLEKKNSNPFIKSTDSATLKQNLNLFEDLSKTLSASNLANTKLNSNAELNFKDVNQKIGFKRKANELTPSPTLANELPHYNPGKKVKKN